MISVVQSKKISASLCIPFFLCCFPFRIYYLVVVIMKKILGPKLSSLTFSYWDLNGLTTHDSTKISLLQAYATMHSHETICLRNDDCGLTIDRYNLTRSDYPRDSKKVEFISHINSIFLQFYQMISIF